MTHRQDTEVLRTALLQRLNDGEFHSGQILASDFALSRTAIANHIEALKQIGVDVFSVKGKGYKVARPIELLNLGKICEYQNDNRHANRIHISNIVGSTNDLIKRMITSDIKVERGTCCLAEAQTNGRGRRGKSWVSPFGCSIYLSMLWKFASVYQALAGLSIMVGVSVSKSLMRLGIDDTQLKWPNDVYHQNKKLAGVLIELEGQVGAQTNAIIGIGLNYHLPQDIQGIDQAFTDIHHTGVTVSRNQLVACIIEDLWHNLTLFENDGLSNFLDDWHKRDWLLNKAITVHNGSNAVHGVSKGIDKDGALLLQQNGSVQAFHGGEISVRAS